MSCLKEEMRKILWSKTLILFLMICILFNIGLIIVSSSVSHDLDESLKNCREQSGKDIFEDIDGSQLGTLYYDERYKDSDILVALMHKKYQRLELALKQLSEQKAALSKYAGELTPYVHRVLFEYLTKALMVEGILLFTFLALETFFVERNNKTLSMVYCSFRGRGIAFDKMFAVLVIGLLSLIGVSLLSYLIFFHIWNFEKIWDANVASSFNYIMDNDEPILMKPFITWTSFTVKQYFEATIVLMAGVWIAWWLLSIIIVLVNKKISTAIGILGGCMVLPFFGMILLKQKPQLYFLNTMSITVNVYYSHMWFTDMGYHAIFPWQETISVILHLLLGVPGVRIGYHVLCRKDVC